MEVFASNNTTVAGRSLWIFLVLPCMLSRPVWVVSGVLPRGGTGAYDARRLVAPIGVMGPSLSAPATRNVCLRAKLVADRVAGAVLATLGIKLLVSTRRGLTESGA